jgi:hypothetical protein
VNVIGQFDEGGNCDINHDNNFLIVHPDILVSGTRVVIFLLYHPNYILQYVTCLLALLSVGYLGGLSTYFL